MNKYDQNKAIVRTTRQPQYPSYKGHKPRFTRTNNAPKRFHKGSPKFTKAQCHACRQYSHIVTHCQLLPQVLVIINFAKKNANKCEYLLKQYTQTNSVNSKKRFVRVLQQMNVLPADDESDNYMD